MDSTTRRLLKVDDFMDLPEFLNQKKQNFMRKTFKLLLTALFFAAIFFACDTNDDKLDDNIVIFKAMLKGSDEVPSNTSTATGTTILTVNKDTKKVNAVTTDSVVTPVAGHIHMAAKGTTGPVIYPFGVNLSSPITSQSDVLTDEQVQALMDEMLYSNLHTAAFPGGEIRGQLMKQ